MWNNITGRCASEGVPSGARFEASTLAAPSIHRDDDCSQRSVSNISSNAQPTASRCSRLLSETALDAHGRRSPNSETSFCQCGSLIWKELYFSLETVMFSGSQSPSSLSETVTVDHRLVCGFLQLASGEKHRAVGIKRPPFNARLDRSDFRPKCQHHNYL